MKKQAFLLLLILAAFSEAFAEDIQCKCVENSRVVAAYDLKVFKYTGTKWTLLIQGGPYFAKKPFMSFYGGDNHKNASLARCEEAMIQYSLCPESSYRGGGPGYSSPFGGGAP